MRGFALLGIYWITIFVFALPGTMGELAFFLIESGPLNSFIAYFSDTYIEGSMRGLFSLLFGVSALIFLSEARLARYKQGPLEWIWRSLIYGSMQPNRKANG